MKTKRNIRRAIAARVAGFPSTERGCLSQEAIEALIPTLQRVAGERGPIGEEAREILEIVQTSDGDESISKRVTGIIDQALEAPGQLGRDVRNGLDSAADKIATAAKTAVLVAVGVPMAALSIAGIFALLAMRNVRGGVVELANSNAGSKIAEKAPELAPLLVGLVGGPTTAAIGAVTPITNLIQDSRIGVRQLQPKE